MVEPKDKDLEGERVRKGGTGKISKLQVHGMTKSGREAV